MIGGVGREFGEHNMARGLKNDSAVAYGSIWEDSRTVWCREDAKKRFCWGVSLIILTIELHRVLIITY